MGWNSAGHEISIHTWSQTSPFAHRERYFISDSNSTRVQEFVNDWIRLNHNAKDQRGNVIARIRQYGVIWRERTGLRSKASIVIIELKDRGVSGSDQGRHRSRLLAVPLPLDQESVLKAFAHQFPELVKSGYRIEFQGAPADWVIDGMSLVQKPTSGGRMRTFRLGVAGVLLALLALAHYIYPGLSESPPVFQHPVQYSA